MSKNVHLKFLNIFPNCPQERLWKSYAPPKLHDHVPLFCTPSTSSIGMQLSNSPINKRHLAVFFLLFLFSWAVVWLSIYFIHYNYRPFHLFLFLVYGLCSLLEYLSFSLLPYRFLKYTFILCHMCKHAFSGCLFNFVNGILFCFTVWFFVFMESNLFFSISRL